ncbi:MAG: hypothetical protein GEU73_11405 [Chloroflexi bacterium]|nr:hypothetical protein [Chloroflexota bacterium]
MLCSVATTDVADILGDATVHAVDVCLPSKVHREFVVAALQAGKHVFCETPFALTIEDAHAMIDAARSGGRLLLVALLMRSIDFTVSGRQAIASGELGRPLAAHAYRLGSYLRRESREFKPHYSDPTTELMTFDFDLLNWFFGLPDEVYAAGSAMADGTIGHVSATLRYPDFIATVEASGAMPVGFPFSVGFRVIGEKQALEFTARFPGDATEAPDISALRYEMGAKEISTEGGDPYEAECRYFVECVRGNADPELLSANRALEALLLSVATQQSLRDGRPVRLSRSPGRS